MKITILGQSLKTRGQGSTSILFLLIFLPILSGAQGLPVAGELHPVQDHQVEFPKLPEVIPAAHAVDAPLLGNGSTAVAIGGTAERQLFYLARNDFWRMTHGLNESWPAVLGKLEIHTPQLRRGRWAASQDLHNAATEINVHRLKYRLLAKARVIATEDLLLLELTNTGARSLDYHVTLFLPGTEEKVDNPPFDTIFEDVTTSKRDRTKSSISRCFEKGVEVKTLAAAACIVLTPDKDLTGFLNPGETIELAVAFSSLFHSSSPLISATQHAEETRSGGRALVNELITAHENWWHNYWAKSSVDIGGGAVERQYYLSLYGLASCSRDPRFPAPIFGSWTTRERPHWNGDYHLNYNHIAPWYGLYSSNRIEQADPQDAPILDFVERGKKYSRELYGIEGGLLYPVGVGPLGMETTRRNELMENHRSSWLEHGEAEGEGLFFGQKSNAAYCAVNLATRWYMTRDLDYARKIYPFVTAAAKFWEEYLLFINGRYEIHNDAIHEGTIGTMNPILSLGLVKNLLKLAVDLEKQLKMQPQKLQSWNHIITHLSDYPTQQVRGKTLFRYTERGVDWWGNNTLGIQHIYPAGQIGLGSDPKLLEISRNTIERMERWIDYNGSNSFFPAAVRIGYDPVEVFKQLRHYTGNTYPNGFQQDNPHGIENWSTVPNTINEMLLQSHEGVIRLFPVWDRRKEASFRSLRAYGAFLVSADLKAGKAANVIILSEKGEMLVLENPWPEMKLLVEGGGSKKRVSGARVSLATVAGVTYRIRPIGSD